VFSAFFNAFPSHEVSTTLGASTSLYGRFASLASAWFFVGATIGVLIRSCGLDSVCYGSRVARSLIAMGWLSGGYDAGGFMRPYIPKIGCCCPGHDTYSCEHYNNRRSVKAHTVMSKKGHRVMRRRARIEVKTLDVGVND
jgi:hypothetical protein